MYDMNARHLVPLYAETENPNNVITHDFVNTRRLNREMKVEKLKKRYGLALIALFAWAASMMIGCCLTGVIVRHNAVKETQARCAAQYAAELEAYKREQAEAEQAAHWLSGDASREAFINQQIEIGARAAGASQMRLDVQKGGVVMTILARVMSKQYPDSFKEVAEEKDQIPFYSASNTYTQHDWDIAESIIRPYYEQGKVPTGLTDQYCWAEWSANDYVLRDKWENDSSAHFLRFSA